jgi:hypothetical protein
MTRVKSFSLQLATGRESGGRFARLGPTSML